MYVLTLGMTIDYLTNAGDKHVFLFKLETLEGINKIIGANLKDCRVKAKMSQSAVAKADFIAQPQLSMLEKGKRGIDVLDLIQLAALYKVGIEDVIPPFALNRLKALEQLNKFR